MNLTENQLLFLGETVLDNKYCIHKPTEKQTEFLLRPELEVLYGGAAAGGKLINIRTSITTDVGITDIEHIKVGDLVFDENGNQCVVLAVSDIEYGHDCYELTFSDGSKLIAADTHLWPTVSALDEFKNKRRTAEYRQLRRETRAKRGTGKRPDLAKRNSSASHVYLEPRKLINRSTKELFETQTYRGRSNYYIPVCKPLKYPKRKLPLDPYVLGVWLGDGTKCSSGITGIDQGIFEEIRARGFDVRTRKGSSCRITGLITKIRSIGCFENKHIPVEYFIASVKQRVDLLRGLMDTDGYATKSGGCEIQLTRKELIDDVSKLLHTLGIKHTVHEGEAKLYGRVVSKKWRIKFYTNIKSFNLKRKAERQKRRGIRPVAFRRYITEIKQVPSVPTRCIQVSSESGCYLVGDSLIPTHNSDALLMAALQYSWVPNYSALILRRTYADLALPGAIMDRSFEWLRGTDAFWRDRDKTWDFPSGATLTFGYLETDKDRYRYQSSEFQFIAFDELTQFTEIQYAYLFSRLRKLKTADIPIRMRAASNPGGIGHDWVKARFMGEPYPDRVFIGAKLDDNPHIDRLAYEESLKRLDYVTREQLRRGDWDITESGGIFHEPKLIDIREVDLSKCEAYGACDPSEGGSDFAAIGIILKLPDGRLLPWACDMSVDNQSTTIGKIIDFQRDFKPRKFWIEANSLGHAKNAPGMSLFEKDLRARAQAEGVTIPFAFIWNTANKEDRIRSMEPHYSNGTLIFRSDWNQEYPTLISQLKAFRPGNKAHDDGPDMLEMCVSGLFNEQKARKHISIPKAPLIGRRAVI